MTIEMMQNLTVTPSSFFWEKMPYASRKMWPRFCLLGRFFSRKNSSFLTTQKFLLLPSKKREPKIQLDFP